MFLFKGRIQIFLWCAFFSGLFLPTYTLAQTLSTVNEKVFEAEEQELYLPSESGRLKLDLRQNIYDLNYLNLDRLPENIDLKKIKVIGNTVIPTTELQSIIDSESSPTISKNTLRQVIQRINKAYRDRGYLTSGVFTEPKLQPNGIIFIPITEGKIEDVQITGLKRLRDGYIRNRLIRNDGNIFNQEDLKQELQLLQVNDLIDNISGTIVPGSSIGSSILEIEVREDDPFYVELSLDNLGFPTSGSFRRQLKINHDNLIGFGDRFYAAYTNSDGSNALDNLAYIFPINSHDGTVAINYGIGKLELIEPPLEDLDIDSNFNFFQLAINQPLYQTAEREFTLRLSFSRVARETTLFDEPFPISRGAESDGELNVSTIDFAQIYTKRGKSDRLDLGSQFVVGVNAFDATDNDDAPDSNFVLWRGQASYLRKFTKDLSLSFNSYLQFSDRPLVYLEQTPFKLFTIGREEEAFILRGYRRSSLQADNGVFATTEFRANVLKIDSLNSIIQLTPFIDFGTAWNDDDVELDESTLISTGLGIRLLVNDNFRARVDWGFPLIERDLDGGSLQEDGVTFNIEYRPF